MLEVQLRLSLSVATGWSSQVATKLVTTLSLYDEMVV